MCADHVQIPEKVCFICNLFLKILLINDVIQYLLCWLRKGSRREGIPMRRRFGHYEGKDQAVLITITL